MGLDAGGLDRTNLVLRGTGGDDPIAAGLSSEYAGDTASESGERPSCWLGDRANGGSGYCGWPGGVAAWLKVDCRRSLLLLVGLPVCGIIGPLSGTGVGALGTSCMCEPMGASTEMPIGLNVRNEPAVLAVTRRDSGPPPNGALILLVTWVMTVALFFLAGPSSPSVPSS